MPSEDILDQEKRALESLYRYGDARGRAALRRPPRSGSGQPNAMLMHFDFEDDPRAGRFVNPLDVEPLFDTAPGVCQLDLELVSLHVDERIESMLASRRRPLEHRLVVEAPITIGGHRDRASWILCSAIEVVPRRRAVGRDRKLMAFADASRPTLALPGQEAIQIEAGTVRLSHGLWGHTREDMFLRFFEPLARSFEPPLLATAGLPALVPTTVGFLDRMVATYTGESELTDLWQTRSLDFAISRDAERIFKLRSGYWVVIDSDYVERYPDLAGHRVDFASGTFEILNPDDEPIHAAYLASRIHLEPGPAAT